jgi:hypothetical protein
MTTVATTRRTPAHVIVPDVRSRMLDGLHAKQKELVGVKKELIQLKGTLMRAMLTPAASKKLQGQVESLAKKQTALERQIQEIKKNPIVRP